MAGSEVLQSLVFGKALARRAGRRLLSHYNKVKWESGKGSDPRDIVTNADIDSQQFIVESIRKKFPSHGVYGEESGQLDDQVAGSDYRWVVDPLDGTVNYAAGLDLWCVSMALVDRRGNPQASVVFLPAFNELFHAVKGGGAYLNGSRIHVSRRPAGDCLVSVGMSHHPDRAATAIRFIKLVVGEFRRVRVLGW